VPFFDYGCDLNTCHNFIEVRFRDGHILEAVEDRTLAVRARVLNPARGGKDVFTQRARRTRRKAGQGAFPAALRGHFLSDGRAGGATV
jgi:hypothetical protein